MKIGFDDLQKNTEQSRQKERQKLNEDSYKKIKELQRQLTGVKEKQKLLLQKGEELKATSLEGLEIATVLVY